MAIGCDGDSVEFDCGVRICGEADGEDEYEDEDEPDACSSAW